MNNVTCGSNFLICRPQKVTGQQEAINNLLQKTTVDGESTQIKEELSALREQLVNRSQELEVGGANTAWQSGAHNRKVSFLCSAEHDKSPVALAIGI